MRRMEFFDHITKEPLNVYADSECTIALAMPVYAYADGTWPSIFLEGGNWAERVYSVRLFDRRGNLIFTLDPLCGEPRLRSFWWRVLFGED